jgi:hypothetical protein
MCVKLVIKGRKLKEYVLAREVKAKKRAKHEVCKVWTECSGITKRALLESTQRQFNPTHTHDVKYEVKKESLP